MIIIDCEQGSDEWFKEKLGKPSASNASKILTNEGKPSKQRDGYLHELVAESITGEMVETYKNNNMEEGSQREDESRNFYELIHGVEVRQVGVIYKDKSKEILCSPDGIVNDSRGVEMKNPLPKTQVKYLLAGILPSEYYSQVQFSLYVTGFESWDFLSYSPGLKSLIIKVERDEKFLKALAIELKLFCEKLKETINKIK